MATDSVVFEKWTKDSTGMTLRSMIGDGNRCGAAYSGYPEGEVNFNVRYFIPSLRANGRLNNVHIPAEYMGAHK